MEKGLVLNKSYDIFNLGEDISKYEKLAHAHNHFEDPCSFDFDSYEIEIHGYNITIESEDGRMFGVQWHPEELQAEHREEAELFRYFTSICRRNDR